MRIIEQTDSSMVMKRSVVGGVAFGAILTLVGAYFLYDALVNGVYDVTFWISVAGVVVGILIMLLSQEITITLDKSKKNMSVVKKAILRGSTKDYPLDAIASIELYEQYSNQTVREANGAVASRSQLQESLSILMKDGSRFSLDHSNSGRAPGMVGVGVMLDRDREEALGEQVAAFLGVPFNRLGPGFPTMPLNIPPGGGLPPIV